MADLSVLDRLDKIELAELVSVLAYRMGDLPADAVIEARRHAATRRIEIAGAAVTTAFEEHVRVQSMFDRAVAEGRSTDRLRKALRETRLAYGRTVARERDAHDRLTRLLEERRT